jgi:hypothetical protein
MLKEFYPEFDWLPWKFKDPVPKNYWDDIINQRKFMKWAAKELNVKETKNWHSISWKVPKIEL